VRLHELAPQFRDLVCLGIQREVPGVEQNDERGTVERQ
jgi:hypothetical protein